MPLPARRRERPDGRAVEHGLQVVVRRWERSRAGVERDDDGRDQLPRCVERVVPARRDDGVGCDSRPRSARLREPSEEVCARALRNWKLSVCLAVPHLLRRRRDRPASRVERHRVGGLRPVRVQGLVLGGCHDRVVRDGFAAIGLGEPSVEPVAGALRRRKPAVGVAVVGGRRLGRDRPAVRVERHDVRRCAPVRVERMVGSRVHGRVRVPPRAALRRRVPPVERISVLRRGRERPVLRAVDDGLGGGVDRASVRVERDRVLVPAPVRVEAVAPGRGDGRLRPHLVAAARLREPPGKRVSLARRRGERPVGLGERHRPLGLRDAAAVPVEPDRELRVPPVRVERVLLRPFHRGLALDLRAALPLREPAYKLVSVPVAGRKPRVVRAEVHVVVVWLLAGAVEVEVDLHLRR